MKLELFGTLGPACHDAPTLQAMIETGMTGIRLNLSHGSLKERADWIDSLHQAQTSAGRPVDLLIDLKGRELRTGDMPAMTLETGSTVVLGTAIPLDLGITRRIKPGMRILLDDGAIILQARTLLPGSGWTCEVLQGGLLESRKSLSLENLDQQDSPLCPEDMDNLDAAAACGVTALMVPFVQSGQDLRAVRQELEKRKLNLKLYAKIENEQGCRNLEEIMPLADVIVIARGDLGQNLGLIRLPAAQLDLETRCRKAGKPYMVVTQLLASMTESPVCTRAEANDVFRAALEGAWSLMLTNETAAGRWPVKAMETLCALARQAEEYRQHHRL